MAPVFCDLGRHSVRMVTTEQTDPCEGAPVGCSFTAFDHAVGMGMGREFAMCDGGLGKEIGVRWDGNSPRVFLRLLSAGVS
jgi:hypothetical protein